MKNLSASSVVAILLAMAGCFGAKPGPNETGIPPDEFLGDLQNQTLPWTWDQDSDVAVLLTINGPKTTPCEIEIRTVIDSPTDEGLGFGILRRPASPQSFTWLYTTNAPEVRVSAGGVDSQSALAEPHAGEVTYKFSPVLGETVELLWVGVSLRQDGAEPGVAVSKTCDGAEITLRQMNEACLLDDGQLEGTLSGGSGYSRVQVDARATCPGEHASETGLLLTGDGDGSGELSTPSGNTPFDATMDNPQYLQIPSSPGDHSLAFETFAATNVGAIWYVIGG